MQSVNNLRGVAILCIVFAHAISILPNPAGAGQFLDYFIGKGSLPFMFISGFLFSETAKYFRYGDYLKNKVIFVVVPYVVTSLPASLLYVFHLKTNHLWMNVGWFENLNVVERYLYLLLTGAQLGPLWFIPMIVLYYIASFAFAYLRQSVLLFPVFLISLVVAYFVDRPFGNSNVLQSFVFFIPAYLFGIIANIHYDKIMKLKPFSAYLLVLYVVIFAVIYFLAYTSEQRPTESESLLRSLPLLIIVLAFFAQYMDFKIRFLDMFARLSFFIFFIHGYFPGLVRLTIPVLRSDVRIENPFLETAMIVLAFLMMLFLTLSTYVVLKLLLRDKSRYLIGG